MQVTLIGFNGLISGGGVKEATSQEEATALISDLRSCSASGKDFVAIAIASITEITDEQRSTKTRFLHRLFV